MEKKEMIRITIEGPQGCGKTRIAKIFQEVFSYSGKSSVLIEDGERLYGIGYDVVIQTKVPFKTLRGKK
jgi:thymidylate kinase